jgi:hypothetical protein
MVGVLAQACSFELVFFLFCDSSCSRFPPHHADMVFALVKHAHDRDTKVVASIRDALVDVGRHQPNLVLSSIHEFLRNPSPAKEHRVVLLNIMLAVIELRRDTIDPQLAVGLIELAMREMLSSDEVVPEWQMAASNNLVALGQRFSDEVLDVLLARFPPGTVPHYFVVKTLGALLAAHWATTVPRLKVHVGSHV